MKKRSVLLACSLSVAVIALAHNGGTKPHPVPVAPDLETVNNENVGTFMAEGKTHETKFVRVLFAAEGSERDDDNNSITPLIYDSTDPNGKAVKVRRFQITAKNTGYDEVQQSQEADYKLKSVKEGVKLHIEIPVNDNGELQLNDAYVGNAAYNFGTRETRHILAPETVSDIKLNIKKLDLPPFGPDSKPGDGGLVYNQGYIALTFSSKAKHIASDDISDFTIDINGPISVTHIRGKEREKAATSIAPEIVAKNVK